MCDEFHAQIFISRSLLKILFSENFICFCKKMFLQMGIFVLTEHFELKYQTFTKHDGLNLNPVLKPVQRNMYVPM